MKTKEQAQHDSQGGYHPFRRASDKGIINPYERVDIKKRVKTYDEPDEDFLLKQRKCHTRIKTYNTKTKDIRGSGHFHLCGLFRVFRRNVGIGYISRRVAECFKFDSLGRRGIQR